MLLILLNNRFLLGDRKHAMQTGKRSERWSFFYRMKRGLRFRQGVGTGSGKGSSEGCCGRTNGKVLGMNPTCDAKEKFPLDILKVLPKVRTNASKLKILIIIRRYNNYPKLGQRCIAINLGHSRIDILGYVVPRYVKIIAKYYRKHCILHIFSYNVHSAFLKNTSPRVMNKFVGCWTSLDSSLQINHPFDSLNVEASRTSNEIQMIFTRFDGNSHKSKSQYYAVQEDRQPEKEPGIGSEGEFVDHRSEGRIALLITGSEFTAAVELYNRRNSTGIERNYAIIRKRFHEHVFNIDLTYTRVTSTCQCRNVASNFPHECDGRLPKKNARRKIFLNYPDKKVKITKSVVTDPSCSINRGLEPWAVSFIFQNGYGPVGGGLFVGKLSDIQDLLPAENICHRWKNITGVTCLEWLQLSEAEDVEGVILMEIWITSNQLTQLIELYSLLMPDISPEFSDLERFDRSLRRPRAMVAIAYPIATEARQGVDEFLGDWRTRPENPRDVPQVWTEYQSGENYAPNVRIDKRDIEMMGEIQWIQTHRNTFESVCLFAPLNFTYTAENKYRIKHLENFSDLTEITAIIYESRPTVQNLTVTSVEEGWLSCFPKLKKSLSLIRATGKSSMKDEVYSEVEEEKKRTTDCNVNVEVEEEQGEGEEAEEDEEEEEEEVEEVEEEVEEETIKLLNCLLNVLRLTDSLLNFSKPKPKSNLVTRSQSFLLNSNGTCIASCFDMLKRARNKTLSGRYKISFTSVCKSHYVPVHMILGKDTIERKRIPISVNLDILAKYAVAECGAGYSSSLDANLQDLKNRNVPPPAKNL
ncbi:hypothetical protein WN51_11825 [Melipona quadrifasciata]|uniref:Uncharacterized protein n=1 Tax=Melipona quadrifasciata TaxID=166423 RepID=A0A0M9A2S8_9HYME|nr:hypothetical protein WN51_11825 [Melipona quadrifasciata]